MIVDKILMTKAQVALLWRVTNSLLDARIAISELSSELERPNPILSIMDEQITVALKLNFHLKDAYSPALNPKVEDK